MASIEPIDAAGWKAKYEQLREEFEEFCASSKELEAEQDSQLEQSQQQNKRLENELTLLKRQFADLHLQKSTADAEQLRTVTQLRNSLEEAQQKVQQQAAYIARIETESDVLSTHKRELEQSVRDYAEKLETLEEQRAMLETQLIVEKCSCDEIVQRLHDRVRELEEDLHARTAAAAFCNNTASSSPRTTEAVSGGGDSGFATRMNSTPLRPTPQSTFSSHDGPSNNNKRSRPSPVGISPPTFSAAGGVDSTRHHNGAIKSPRYSSADSPPPQLVDFKSIGGSVVNGDVTITSPLKPSFGFSTARSPVTTEPATSTDTSDDKYTVDNSRARNSSAKNDTAYLKVSSSITIDNDDDHDCDHGYSSTPTSDKQQSNAGNKTGADAQRDYAEDDADMESPLPTTTSASSNDDRVSALPQPQMLKNASRKTVDVRSTRTGSVDEIQQSFARKSFIADPSRIQRLMSLSGGLGGVPLSVVENIDAQAARDGANNDGSSSLSTATIDSFRSQQKNNAAHSGRLAAPTPPLSSSSNIAAPNNNSVHVSWFRSMQLVDKALLKLNSLEKNVKQQNNSNGGNSLSNSNDSSTYHFSSTTEKKKIGSSPGTNNSDTNEKSRKNSQLIQNHAPRDTAASVHGFDLDRKQRSVTENTNLFMTSKNDVSAERNQLAAVNNSIKNPNIGKPGILSAYAVPNNNSNGSMRPPSSSQLSYVAAGRSGVGVPVVKSDSRSKLVAPLPPSQQRAGSSSSQSSTLSSMSSKASGDQSGSESASSSSIPAPSKLGAPLMRTSMMQQNADLRLRNATAPAAAADAPLRAMLPAPAAIAPVGFVKALRQPTSAHISHQQHHHQAEERQQQQQLRQPYYQQSNVTANNSVTGTVIGVAGRKQQHQVTLAVHPRQQT